MNSHTAFLNDVNCQPDNVRSCMTEVRRDKGNRLNLRNPECNCINEIASPPDVKWVERTIASVRALARSEYTGFDGTELPNIVERDAHDAVWEPGGLMRQIWGAGYEGAYIRINLCYRLYTPAYVWLGSGERLYCSTWKEVETILRRTLGK